MLEEKGLGAAHAFVIIKWKKQASQEIFTMFFTKENIEAYEGEFDLLQKLEAILKIILFRLSSKLPHGLKTSIIQKEHSEIMLVQ